MIFSDMNLGSWIAWFFWVFVFFAYLMVLFSIIGDLFRDSTLNGWVKAIWIIFLIFLPFITALVYLIARGNGMRDRTIKAQAEAKQHFDSYVRQQAHGGSPADELHKLNDLKEKGAISAEEFDKAKAKLLA